MTATDQQPNSWIKDNFGKVMGFFSPQPLQEPQPTNIIPPSDTAIEIINSTKNPYVSALAITINQEFSDDPVRRERYLMQLKQASTVEDVVNIMNFSARVSIINSGGALNSLPLTGVITTMHEFEILPADYVGISAGAIASLQHCNENLTERLTHGQRTDLTWDLVDSMGICIPVDPETTGEKMLSYQRIAVLLTRKNIFGRYADVRELQSQLKKMYNGSPLKKFPGFQTVAVEYQPGQKPFIGKGDPIIYSHKTHPDEDITKVLMRTSAYPGLLNPVHESTKKDMKRLTYDGCFATHFPHELVDKANILFFNLVAEPPYDDINTRLSELTGHELDYNLAVGDPRGRIISTKFAPLMELGQTLPTVDEDLNRIAADYGREHMAETIRNRLHPDTSHPEYNIKHFLKRLHVE